MTTTSTQLAALDTVASLSPLAADLVAVGVVSAVVMVVLMVTLHRARVAA